MHGASCSRVHERRLTVYTYLHVCGRFCYKVLDLLLVAVVTNVDGSDAESRVILNPDKSFLIDANTKGFFICGEQEEVKRSEST